MTNQTENPMLPEELLWAEGGHASDVVLTALADGQAAILPPPVIAHVHACAACTKHLGGAVLLSLHAGTELALAARAPLVRAPSPRLPIALGLALAVLGLVPRLLDASGPSSLAAVKAFAAHDVPLLVTAAGTIGRKLVEPGSALGLALTYGALTLVVGMAVALVRLLPQKEASQ